MPVYDYKCAEHGLFYELATLSDYDQPCACPQCGALSPRVLVLPPELLQMSKERKQAFATNEKAQHEPIVSSAASRAVTKADGGCGCGDHRKRPSKLMYTAQGEKFFPTMRPWMISH